MKFSHGQMWKLSHLSECDSFYSDCLYSSSNLRIESGNGLFLACLLWVVWFSKRMPEGLPEIVPQASPSLRVPKWPNLENILKGKNVYVWYVSHLICLLCWICCGDPSWWGRAEYEGAELTLPYAGFIRQDGLSANADQMCDSKLTALFQIQTQWTCFNLLNNSHLLNVKCWDRY